MRRLVVLLLCLLFASQAEECELDEHGECQQPSCTDHAPNCTRASCFDPDQLPHCPWTCLRCPTNNNENKHIATVYSKHPQLVPDKATLAWLQTTDEQMLGTSNPSLSTCFNDHAQCTLWAARGECDSNPGYMHRSCAPACGTCGQGADCSWDASQPGIWHEKGDLDAMFLRILDTYDNVTVHSGPAAYVQPGRQAWIGPWVLTIDHFLTDDECDQLIALGAQRGYERSLDVGPNVAHGVYDGMESQTRTSTNAWCIKECFDATPELHQRMVDLTLIPMENHEYLQLLKYEVGQFYGAHHDYIAIQRHRAQGVRILTLFLYLNDVPAGGGTRFPHMNLAVTPKKGRVLLWPSVWNDRPDDRDYRTEHEALPVLEGVKYGANAWVHQRDFKTPWKKGCH